MFAVLGILTPNDPKYPHVTMTFPHLLIEQASLDPKLQFELSYALIGCCLALQLLNNAKPGIPFKTGTRPAFEIKGQLICGLVSILSACKVTDSLLRIWAGLYEKIISCGLIIKMRRLMLKCVGNLSEKNKCYHSIWNE